MAAGQVGQYSIGAFTSPNNGDDLDASVVEGNDNTIATSYNEHDADPTIHVQSSALANRPAAGTAQRVWLTTDGYRIYIDTGVAWQEVAYIGGAGGTLSGDLLFTDALYDIGKSGATRPRDGFFSRNFVIGGTLTVNGIATINNQLTLVPSGSTYAINSNGSTTVLGQLINTNAAGFGLVLRNGNDANYTFTIINAAGTLNTVHIFGDGSADFAGVVQSTSVNGWAIGNKSGTARVQYGASSVTAFSLLTAANGFADLYAGAQVLAGTVTWGTDATYDIGASGANRPRDLNLSRNVNAGGSVIALGSILSGSSLSGGSTAASAALCGTSGSLGFFGTSGTTQQTVTGSRAGNAALASLITKLAAYGFVVDGTSA
jgi:hypothetical protein